MFQWQEFIFLFGNLLNAAFLIPMLVARHKPPLISSGPVALTLMAFALAFFSLGQYVSTFGVGAAGLLWVVLFLQRIWQLHRERAKRDLFVPTPDERGFGAQIQQASEYYLDAPDGHAVKTFDRLASLAAETAFPRGFTGVERVIRASEEFRALVQQTRLGIHNENDDYDVDR